MSECVGDRERERNKECRQGEALVIQSVCQEIIKTILKDAKRSRKRRVLRCGAGVNCFSSC
ncbi:MAG: hypothetical protein ATN36_08700 [Epulopiscium sp. Nele67-Bin005]|nr:MAG: hypothetical protein ATN36_08700 [Epulopiscium sp. Nele67-Bin005]